MHGMVHGLYQRDGVKDERLQHINNTNISPLSYLFLSLFLIAHNCEKWLSTEVIASMIYSRALNNVNQMPHKWTNSLYAFYLLTDIPLHNQISRNLERQTLVGVLCEHMQVSSNILISTDNTGKQIRMWHKQALSDFVQDWYLTHCPLADLNETFYK